MLESLRVVQIGSSRVAAVCTRLFADLGSRVEVIGASGNAAREATLLDDYLDLGKVHGSNTLQIIDAMREADLVVLHDSPARLAACGLLPADLEGLGLNAALVYISAYGLSGPQANDPASDLTLLCASGIARVLTGQVDDVDEAPVRAVGEQSAFICGLAAACAGMHLLLDGGQRRAESAALRYVDVSMQESLATLDIQALTRAGLGRPARPRRRNGDGNGATVTILPCVDGYVAISPREDHQWRRWLEVMGSPEWGGDPRFLRKSDRIAHFDALHALMAQWSCRRDKQSIADAAQNAHVPSFPLGTAGEQLRSEQLVHRRFFKDASVQGRVCKLPGLPFAIELFPAQNGHAQKPPSCAPSLPLAGVRVLDFSWVIAGPTTTRYLAALGAEVIKVEAPGRGDPGRTSDLHTVLGQAKRAVTLDLKNPAGRELALSLVRASDVVIENFATGVMDRLGLGEPQLRAIKPDLIYLSASGLGRSGPQSSAVAYGTLLQCYAGFAALNGHPHRAPRVGMAWLDPMCALQLTFIVAASLWRRAADGVGVRIDFSMVEALLWTMAEPLLQAQLGAAGSEPRARGNASNHCAPHGVYKAAGDDAWIAIAVCSQQQWQRLCGLVPELASMAQLECDERVAQRESIDAALARWCALASSTALHARLVSAQIPASAVLSANDLHASAHLEARGFWDPAEGGRLPGLPWGLPWRGDDARQQGSAPALGADNVWMSREVLGLSAAEHLALCAQGAFGKA
ncbi:MAG: crotonobetainyl-CoA:carnitine CoA-transferase CaiB-like acyl-CoA transferase [Gammaproteobacteria bacterium]|jgi:crotonobetainyl-CoA:carnitine CoA-transferase CaiB-like acyl-CoA transferase